MNYLEQLKLHSKVVADTGDFESMKKFKPLDATTNPSLIYSAAQNPHYSHIIEDAIHYAKNKSINSREQMSYALDKLAIGFGMEILKIVPGRVSTEVDARLSFDTNGSIKKAKELIGLYNESGIDTKRILIKIASTWEGIKAAKALEKEGIHCNLTLLFSLTQAITCADAGVQLVSPFVGRILDWHKKNQNVNDFPPGEDPGVLSVISIYNYYKKFGYKTEIMAASFRNIGEIVELAGCDLMTISPVLLNELEQKEGLIEKKLFEEKAKMSDSESTILNEKKFRWLMNENAMATEKLAEGIRKFTEDLIKLEKLIESKL